MFKTKFYFLIFLNVLSFSLFAQVGAVDSLSEYYTSFSYESGNLSSHGILINGKPNGYWITFHENGNLKSEGNRIDFKLDSNWYFYNDSGNLIKSIAYKNDLRNGLTVTYDSIFIISEEYFVDNVKDSLTITYYPTKEKLVKSKVNYEDGKENGMAYYFDTDGRVTSITEFNKGFIVSKEEINRYNRRQKKQGLWKEFYPNWRVKIESTYREGLLNGYVKYYSPDGQLTKAELYVDGVLQVGNENSVNFEIIPTYNNQGVVIQETTYNGLGQKDGIERIYNDTGRIISSSIYKNDLLLSQGGIIDEKGRKQEVWKEFYPNKTIKSEGKFLDNKKFEKWTYFYENGKAEQQGSYNKNGKPVGNWIWYFQNGDTLRYEQYRRGLEDGILIEKTDSGGVIRKGDYIDGFREGEWIYELNDHIEKGKYVYGTKNGLWEHFHTNGELIFKGNFIEGRPEGKHKWWYPNGKVKEEGNYAYGEKDGIWKKYNEDGTLKITIDFKNGEEFKIDGQKFKIDK